MTHGIPKTPLIAPFPSYAPYLVKQSSLCTLKQAKAHTLVPQVLHITLPQYPQISQNRLTGILSSSSPISALASQYVNGGTANSASISLDDGAEGTRDFSNGSLSPGCSFIVCDGLISVIAS